MSNEEIVVAIRNKELSIDDALDLARVYEKINTIDEIGMKLCAEIYFGYEVEERVCEVLEQMKKCYINLLDALN